MSVLWNIFEVLAILVASVATLGVVGWTAGALYFDVGRSSWLSVVLVAAWVGGVGAAFLLWRPFWIPSAAVGAFFATFLLWWLSQRPSLVRDWDPNFVELPHARVEGDVVTIHNVRHTRWRSLEDFTPRYETRRFRLSNLAGADVLIAYWGSSWLCHPMVVFDFGEDGHVTMSVEVRYRRGQVYGFFRSLYRQQELIYVVCDERDAILRRTKHSRGHDVYLYRLQADIDLVRTSFLEYIASINDLHARPRWYNGVTTNCTTSIYRQGTRRVDWDWRWLFNGKLDRMLYERGLLKNTLEFNELKRQSRVNEIANRAPYETFSATIRAELPTYP